MTRWMFRIAMSAAWIGLAACGSVRDVPGDGGSGGGDGGGGGSDGGPGDGGPGLGHVAIAVEVGSGGGTVTANAGDLSCGARCSADVAIGSKISLMATAPAGSMFAGWRGAAAVCGRMPSCELTVQGDLAIGARFAQQGTAAWASVVGSLGSEGFTQIATDRDGSAVVAVSFTANLTFAGTTYTNLGSLDFVLVKFTPAGDVAWVKAYTAPGEQYSEGVAIDPRNGDVVVWGAYGTDLDAGGPSPLPLPAGDTKDFFVVKYSADGQFQWQHAIHASDDDDPGLGGIAIDAAGDIIVAGAFYTSIDLGDGPLTSTAGEAFAGKLSGANGSVIWKKKLGGPDSGLFINNIALDSTGSVLLAASFSSTCNVGSTSLTPTQQDGLIVKLAGNSGAFQFQRQVGGAGNESVVDVAADASNNVYAAVAYEAVAGQPVTFAGQTLAGTGTGAEIVIGKLNSINGLVWATRFGTAGFDTPAALTILGDGNLGVTGRYGADIVFGTKSLTNLGGADGFVVRLGASNGVPSYAARIGGALDDAPFSFRSTGSTMLVAGTFQTHTGAAGIELDGVGGFNDVFIADIALPAP